VLDKKAFLLRAGDRATETGVVLQGLLREYFLLDDGTERTTAFVRESRSTGSLADLLSDRPSRTFIVAEEPVRMLAIDFAELREVIHDHPSVLRLHGGMACRSR
jgi:CRP-like cAMP-binding protein